jgi:hypothetical protein
MTRRLGPFMLILALAALPVLLMSCGKSFSEKMAEKVTEKIVEKVAESEGEDIDIDISGDSVSITSDSGETVTMGGTKLPDGWPKSVPFNDDLEILYSGSTKAGGVSTWTVNGTFDGGAEELYDYNKSELPGWEQTGDSAMTSEEGAFYTLQMTDGTYEMSLIITGDANETAAVVTVSETE